MARKKFRKDGKIYWEENRAHRNKVVSLHKKSTATYFSEIVSNTTIFFVNRVSFYFVTGKNGPTLKLTCRKERKSLLIT